MGTRTYAQVAPTAATIALNASIFGYAGHSLVTPHTALKQLWWTDEHIDAKVTRRFVVSKLRGEEREFLDRPLAFGEGLTDDTYMEWILERSRRLFLILTEVGVPDRIFGAIDDSWADDDLPIALRDIHKLELAIDHDEALEKKFFDLQFLYLLRQLRPGSHIDYGPNEHIPMEYVHKLPPAVSLQSWDRVHLPGKANEIFTRRKFTVGHPGHDNHKRIEFLRDVQRTNNHQHHHISQVWASYTSEDAGYILSRFVPEHTLGTFIDHRTPPQFMRISSSARPVLLVEWMHCLADVIASLHHRGTYHGAVRPSNILIDHDNHVAFSDIGRLRTFQTGKKVNKTEVRDYSAPELQIELTSRVRVLVDTCREAHGDDWSPEVSPTLSRSDTMSPEPRSPTFSSSSSIRNFSRHLYFPRRTGSVPTIILSPMELTPPASPTLLSTVPQHSPDYSQPHFHKFANLRDLPSATPQASDVFSLGCIFLDILTFMLKGKLTDFVKFRSVRSRSLPFDGTNATIDTSFHADTTKIDVWMAMLREEAFRHNEPVFRSVPELLKLTKRMLSQNAEMRPSAKHVRDRVEEIVARESRIETLCCAGREWESVDQSNMSPNLRDSMSVFTSNTWRSNETGNGSEEMDPCSPNDMRIETRSVMSHKMDWGFSLPWTRKMFVRKGSRQS